MQTAELSVMVMMLDSLIDLKAWDAIDDLYKRVRPSEVHLTISLALLRVPSLYRKNFTRWTDYRDKTKAFLDMSGKDSNKILRGLL